MKFIFVLFALIGLGLTGNATELSGVVKSEDGKPLPGVQILTYHQQVLPIFSACT